MGQASISHGIHGYQEAIFTCHEICQHYALFNESSRILAHVTCHWHLLLKVSAPLNYFAYRVSSSFMFGDICLKTRNTTELFKQYGRCTFFGGDMIEGLVDLNWLLSNTTVSYNLLHSLVHNKYFSRCLSISLCDKPNASEGWQAG